MKAYGGTRATPASRRISQSETDMAGIESMNFDNTELLLDDTQPDTALELRVSSLALASINPETQGLLLKMFSDPYLLDKDEKVALLAQLRLCVERYREVSELRVLLGMAMCVNMDVHSAIDQLEESVRLAPDSFIAQLKLGELWMRLRVCDKAEEHTRLAAMLAQSMPQSDLARKQAAIIRNMKRTGVERGGYKSLLRPAAWFRRLWQRPIEETSIAVDLR